MEVGRRAGGIVEIAGVAGSGKSTLFRTIAATRPIHVGVRPCDRTCIPLAFRGLRLLPAGFIWSELRRGRFPRDLLQSMVYLESWLDHLSGPEYVDPAPVLYDHGPFFRLAKIRAFGPPGGAALQGWWESVREAWSDTMTLVVWLDAPDPLLLERSRKRNVAHPCKQMSDEEGCDWLGRYRTAFDESLSVFRQRKPGDLVRFDTSSMTADEIATSLIERLGPRDG